MRPMRSPRLALAIVALLALASCYDGPFAHANPNDPDARFTMRLEADRDTVSPGSPAVQFVLVTEPAMPGYRPTWKASIDTLVAHTENGRFILTDLPEFAVTVQVTASFMSHSVTRPLVLAPTP